MASPRSVGRQLLTQLVALFLGATVVVTLAETWWLLGRLDADMARETRELAASFGPPLAAALWDYDETQRAVLLETLSLSPIVGRVRVLDADGTLLEQGSPVPLGAAQHFSLVHKVAGVTHPVGELVLEPSLELARQRALEVLWAAAIRTSILVAGLSVLLVLVGRRAVGQPLARISRQVAHLDPEGSEDLDLDLGPEAALEFVQVAGAFRDLVVRYRLTIDRVGAQEAQLRSLLGALPDLVWFKDPEGVYLACNARFEAFFGRPEAEICGKTDYDFLDPALADFFRRHDRQAIEAQGPRRNEEEVVFASDGHREWLETIKTPVYDPQGRLLGVLGIGRDITERKRTSQELGRLLDEVQRSHKLDSLGHLSSGLAHEMNNVLAVILGLSSIQAAEAEPGSRQRRALEDIQRAAARGGQLVKNLLAFARQGPAESRVFDLTDLVQHDRNLLERMTASKARLVLEAQEAGCWVKGDPSALMSALLNLCGNAVDALGDGGEVKVTVARRGDEVEVVVEDNGTGMTPSVRARALEPFFTTKEVGRGTGLGLALVDQTVKAHGGRMDLDSVWGQGTTVRLTFPGVEAPQAPGPSAAAPAAEAGPRRILVVDDDELVRTSTAELVEALGHEVEVAAGGLQALERLEAPPPVDLIILDKNMPGLGGRGVLQRLRSQGGRWPVLLATGQLDQEALDLEARDPLVSLLAKPFTMDEIDQAIRKAVGKGP